MNRFRPFGEKRCVFSPVPKGPSAAQRVPAKLEQMNAPSSRTQVRRLPKRGQYDPAVIHSILDEGFLCHVGFVHEGSPVVIPTGYARSGNTVYIHGSAASRMLRALDQGVPVSIAVTLIDGLVLARSAFHHSMNYRSVVIFGTALPVTDPVEKNEALRLFTEQVVPGRWAEVRQPTAQELKATSVLKIVSTTSTSMRIGIFSRSRIPSSSFTRTSRAPSRSVKSDRTRAISRWASVRHCVRTRTW